MKSVAADNSFFSCLFCHIRDLECLCTFLDFYDFYVGSNIFEKELPKPLKTNPKFKSKIKIMDKYDYTQLVLPFLERTKKHSTDGEYEAIGIAYFLFETGKLKYLIIDDRKPYNFVKRHFKSLTPYLVGTIGFIRDCCCKDNNINPDYAIDLLEKIKSLTENSDGKIRPCSMDKKNYKSIIDPTIEKIRGL